MGEDALHAPAILRRMSSAHTLLRIGVLALPLAASGCPKNPSNQPVAPAGDSPARPAEPIDSVSAAHTPQGEVEKIHVDASIRALDDILAGAQHVAQSMADEGETIDPMADVQAALLQSGFGPGFLSNIDLSGVHVVSMDLPASDNASPRDAEMSASVAAIDAAKIIESMPASSRPQPLGDNVYELRQNDLRLLMEAASKELRLGLSPDDLKKAAALRGSVKGGPRFQATATNIPVDEIDPVDLLGLPRDLAVVGKLGEVLKELESVWVSGDFGSKQDFEVVLGAKAPFSKLGIEPIGDPRAVGTKVEKVLPADPFFATTVSWGDPALVHKLIDKSIPMDQIPAPFQTMVGGAVEGSHALLDQLANDVAVAFYVGKRGETTMVMAADVEDAAATGQAVHKLEDAIVAALEAHAAMQGKNEAAKFKVSHKKGGLKLGRVKADQLDVVLPKDMREELDEAQLFIDKNTVHMVSFAHEGMAVLAVGADAKGVARDVERSITKAPAASLATNAGLATLREAMNGCQVCMAFDFPEYLRFRLLLLQQTTQDKEVAKETKAKLAALAKIGDLADIGTGFRVEPTEAAAGFVVPQSVLFADKAKLKSLMEINDFVDGSGASQIAVEAPAAPPPTRQPGQRGPQPQRKGTKKKK